MPLRKLANRRDTARLGSALSVGVWYRVKMNLKVKVLDFIKFGGPSVTVLQTFEWVLDI